MYRYEISERLEKILKKLLKKDKARYEATLHKMDEIAKSEDPNRYKNLSYDLSQFKGVHIDSHFVLAFKVDINSELIKFEDLRHHDDIYRR